VVGTSQSVGEARGQASTSVRQAWRPPDERRALQLVLATIWLFDGVLQLQPVMFTRQFGSAMLAPTADGNPSAVAHSITWSARIISAHSVATDAAFAAIQILLGLSIAWRPSLKIGLAASIGWSCAVWWFGEGLGGVIAGTAKTVSGAPGAVLLYAVLAVVLWPTERGGPHPSFTAARAVGEHVARVIWVVVWGALSFFALLGANRSPQGVAQVVRSMTPGEPGWLTSLDRHVAHLVDHRGLAVSVTLAVVFGVVALSVYLPARPARVVTVGAVTIILIMWVVGQNFGGVFTGSATDPNTGPLLVLLVLAYRRRRPSETSAPASSRALAMEVA
jgi:hypothetical protein